MYILQFNNGIKFEENEFIPPVITTGGIFLPFLLRTDII